MKFDWKILLKLIAYSLLAFVMGSLAVFTTTLIIGLLADYGMKFVIVILLIFVVLLVLSSAPEKEVYDTLYILDGVDSSFTDYTINHEKTKDLIKEMEE